MFIQLDDSVISKIEHNDRSVIDFFDAVVMAHRMGNILLVLSRKQSVTLRSTNHINNLARRTLDLLSTRSNDYKAAMRSARRSVMIYANDNMNNYYISGSTAHISYKILTLEHLMTQKFLLAEGKRDIEIISILCNEYYSQIVYPKSYVTYRHLLGGGGALAHVLECETAIPHKGMVVCDRDACGVVPPFIHNTTSQKAMMAAVNLGLTNDTLGISPISPFFGFEVTWGRTIENLIGPNLLNVYLTAKNRRRELSKILAAFPDFPRLNVEEWCFWKFLNLKDSTPDISEQVQHVIDTFGEITDSIEERLPHLKSIMVPSDTIDWIIENQAATRWTHRLRVGIAADFQIPVFRQAVENIALPLLSLAAGDSSARRS